MRRNGKRLAVLLVLMTVSASAGYRLSRAAAPRAEALGTVTIEDGDTLWGLSSELRGERRRWDWIERTCQLNGWRQVPALPIGQTIIVPDWRQ